MIIMRRVAVWRERIVHCLSERINGGVKVNKKVVNTDKAPAAIGPYSQAVQTEGLVFVSGQIPIDPATSEIIKGDIKAQTRQALDNIRAVLTAVGTSMEKVVKTTVFLTNMDDFARMNEAYAEFFRSEPPARACVEVCRLPRGAAVEIEAIATI
jgi:2-iminobutanoate/2-iminopropanoate deaminase